MTTAYIDYSNTVIYKITCKNEEIKDVYVGHTVNFVQRKGAHKNSCCNPKNCSYNCKLYKVIRENGGWNNWKMEMVHFFNCENLNEAKRKEQEYFELLNGTLNSIEPMPKPKPMPMPKPKPTTVVKKNVVDKVTQTILEADTNSPARFRCDAKKYYCSICHFKCSKKSDLERHLARLKHLQNQKRYELVFNDNKTPDDPRWFQRRLGVLRRCIDDPCH